MRYNHVSDSLFTRVENTLIVDKLKVSHLNLHAINACSFHQLNAVGEAINLIENHSLDACLNDELGTLDTWRGGDIKCRPVAAVIALRNFGYSIGFGVKYVRFGAVVVVFAYIFKPHWCAVITIGDYHLVLYD